MISKKWVFSPKIEILIQTHLSKNFPNFFWLRNIIFFPPKKKHWARCCNLKKSKLQSFFVLMNVGEKNGLFTLFQFLDQPWCIGLNLALWNLGKTPHLIWTLQGFSLCEFFLVQQAWKAWPFLNWPTKPWLSHYSLTCIGNGF